MVTFNHYGGEGESYYDSEDSGSDEESFLAGFEGEDDVEECAECNGAIREKAVVKVIKDETLKFCSDECAKDYEESTL